MYSEAKRDSLATKIFEVFAFDCTVLRYLANFEFEELQQEASNAARSDLCGLFLVPAPEATTESRSHPRV
jgi:hypothetical protein